jgi:hypothetical protein
MVVVDLEMKLVVDKMVQKILIITLLAEKVVVLADQEVTLVGVVIH